MTPFRLWVYLQTTPLFWLTATLAAFLVADALAKAAGRRPIVNQVLISIALLGGLLKLTGTDYQTYFNGAQFVHFLLGPATVALGVPIYANFALVRRNVWPLAAALLIGATVAIASAVLVAKAFGAPRAILIALAPKSITAGVAMAVTEALGGAHGSARCDRLRGARLRRGPRLAWHRHGARLRGRSGRRRVRRPRHGTERHRHPGSDPGAAALADRLRKRRRLPSPPRIALA
jgi:LrgB-like family